ncbi:uncharacterized protein LOC124342856 [Daphnia pulicaria]|uniref:uncharacterized protein LOC124342856 n=1 Tax=Daphnia pulicaria TaxID=35523 RepID=UPI001EECD7B3|nr:uncharacterized protein LOC124342856 [Daphnia pulicaria]
MELHLILRTICLVALISTCTVADSTSRGGDSLEDSFSLMGQLEKRQSFKKLRSHNPILIYHQSIRQPRYLPRINSHSEPPVSERDIPRRLIRRGNNKTHSNLQPLLVWNHQLLPNFYNKRQPPFFISSLRKDGYPGGNTKNSLAVKRSGGWLSKSYDETNAQGFPYEKFNYENKDYYQVENDFNEPEFQPAEAMNEDF